MNHATALYLIEAAVRDAVCDLHAAVAIVDYCPLPADINTDVRTAYVTIATLAQRIAAANANTERGTNTER